MERILIISWSMGSGGAEKSLINFLKTMDYSRHQVDLFLFQKSGLFLNQVPKEVHMIDTSPFIETLTGKPSFSLFINKKFNLKGMVIRLCASIWIRYLRLFKTVNEKNVGSILWKLWNPVLPTLGEKTYDTGIAYIHGIPIFYLIDKVKADKKIGWIHTDYKMTGGDIEFETNYFRKLDQINTVSWACRDSFLLYFKELEKKVCVVENKILNLQIQSMAKERIEEKLEFSSQTIVTVSRLSEEKGISIAVHAASILVKKGYPILWYVIGSGDKRKELESQVKFLGLEKHFFLLGERINPYSYMKKAAYYVQPSIYEGKSIAVEEAKVLHKTILVTDYPTLSIQMEGYEKGNICKTSPEDMAKALELLLKER